jgi:hypothetical protein
MKARFILPFLIAAFGFVFTASAQVGYEVQWYCNGVTYNGLIWETGYYNQLKMRVVYNIGGCSSMIEQDLTETYEDGSGYYIGSNPRFLQYCYEGQSYSADSFRWDGEMLETEDYSGNWSLPHYFQPIYSKDKLIKIQNARYSRR